MFEGPSNIINPEYFLSLFKGHVRALLDADLDPPNYLKGLSHEMYWAFDDIND